MRKVAKYAFHGQTSGITTAGLWDSARKMVEDWLSSKGTRQDANGNTTIAFHDGRTATLNFTELTGGDGQVATWIIEEPTESGIFKTSLSLGRNAENFAVTCELEAGAPASVLAPVFFDAKCPQILRDIIDLDIPWLVRDTPISTRPLCFHLDKGGDDLGEMIRSMERSLPLIVVSEDEGLVLHPRIAEAMARDLAGVAIVATSTTSASWRLTNTLGIDWSCYNGALRLYWPLLAVEDNPFRHPLWTPRRLLGAVVTRY